MNRLLDPLFRLGALRPRLSVALVALVTLLLGAGLARLQPDFDVEQMFPIDDPERTAYNEYREQFGRDDGVGLVAIRERTPGPLGVFTSETLQAIDGFAREVERWPEVKRVRALTNARTPAGTGDAVEVRRVIERIPAPSDAAALAGLRAAFIDDPLFRGTLVSSEGDVAVTTVELTREAAGFSGRRHVLERLAPLLRALESGGRREVVVHGMPFARARYLGVVEHDNRVLFPASLALMAILLRLAFGSWRLVLAPFLIIGISCVWVMGALGWAGLTLNFLTQLTPVVILIVGLTDLVHLTLEEGPMLATLRRVGPACFMTCLTAAIGFADLLFTNVVALAQFGLACAAGMIATFVIEALLLPTLVPHGRRATRASGALVEGAFAALDRLLERIARLVPRASRTVLALTAIALSLGGAALLNLRIEARIYDYLDPEHEICRAERFFEERLGAVLPLAVTIDTGRPGGALSVEAVSATAAVRAHMAATSGLRSPRALADDLARMVALIEGTDSVTAALDGRALEERARAGRPITDGALAQSLLIYEGAEEHPVHRLLDFTRQRTQVSARMNDVGTRRTFETVADLERFLEREVRPRFPATRTTGIAYVAQRGNHALAANLAWGFAVSFGVTFVILAALFRSLSVAAIATVPNVLPVVLVFGALGALGEPLKATMAMTCSIAFGIAVDDTIHYLARCEEGIGRGLDHAAAARFAVRECGRAMVLSTLVLGGGFSVFVLSEFEGNRLFGALTALTLVIGMVAEFFVTPALVAALRPRFRPGPAHDRAAEVAEVPPQALQAQAPPRDEDTTEPPCTP